MDFFEENPQLLLKEISRLMIDKKEVAQALQKLVDEYPSEDIPRHVVREVLMKFMGSCALAAYNDHPAIHKLEETLNKARAVTSS